MTGKNFIVLTLLFPLIGLAGIGINYLISIAGPSDADEINAVGYVDETGIFGAFTDQSEEITLTAYPGPEEANSALVSEEVDEYFIIPANYLERGQIVRYHKEKELEISGETFRTIREFLQDNLLSGRAGPEVAERIKFPLAVTSVRLGETGELAADQGGVAAFIVPLAFGFLLILAIGSSSGTLLQGMGEEKQNRIMEVLLSSVSTRQLLLGKVLGLGGAGLLQIVFWLLSMLLLLQLASSTIGGLFSTIQVPDSFIVLGLVYFILGYLFFAIMQAGIGAIIPNPKESPQFAVAFILPAILPFYVAVLFLRDNPDHIIGTIFTFIPMTAPMAVFVRLGLSEIPGWQLALSISIMILSIIGATLLAAKTFRVFLLMYGKTPRFKEILRQLKEA